MRSIRTKIIAAILLTSFLVAGVISGYTIYRMKVDAKENLALLRQTMLTDFDRSMKGQVENAVSLVQALYKQQMAGAITEQEAKQRAADYLRQIRFNGEDYFWIDTYEGVNVVLYGRKDVEGKSRWDSKDTHGKLLIQEIIKAGRAGGGFSEFYFPKPGQTEALPKRSYSLAFDPYKWVIGTGNWYEDIDKAVLAQQQQYEAAHRKQYITQAVIALISLLLSAVLAFLLGRSLTRPLIKTQETVNELAKGNLTVKLDGAILNRNDEIGSMAHALANMIKNYSAMIRSVSSGTEHLSAMSQQLTASAQESTKASTVVAESSSQVAEGSQTQLAAISDVSSVVEELGASTEEVAATSSGVSASSKKMLTMAEQGGIVISSTIQQMGSIKDSVTASARLVEKLGERSNQIGQIVDTISSIAGQTNLLALNAAIEAARAGEQGRGFAVVADEVRKLAEQSQVASQEISDIIKEIQQDTLKAVEAMHSGEQEVGKGTEYVKTAGQTFSDILSAVQNVSAQVDDISAAIEEMAKGTQTIVESVKIIEGYSKDAVLETQTVSAAAEEQTASMHEIAESSGSLADIAGELQQQIIKFRV